MREAGSCQIDQMDLLLNADHRQATNLNFNKADETTGWVTEDGLDQRSFKLERAIEGSKAPGGAVETSEWRVTLAWREVNGAVSKPVDADNR